MTDHLDSCSSDPSANAEFVTDGYVFVPNARVELQAGSERPLSVSYIGWHRGELGRDRDYRDPSAAATTGSSVCSTSRSNARSTCRVTVDAATVSVTVSRAIIEINIDESYAINGWTVDPNVGTSSDGTTATTTTTTTLDAAADDTTSDRTDDHHDHDHDHDDRPRRHCRR